MNRDEIIDYFEVNDDIENREVPNGWQNYDYESAYDKFLKLIKFIEEKIGLYCEFEGQGIIQKASFIGNIILPADIIVKKEKVVIRVSHFGSMITIYGKKHNDFDGVIDDYKDIILEAINESGYVLIPYDLLYAKYPYNRRIKNWGHRYFEYI